MLSYMDFPYAGGKMGLANETSFNGRGDGAANKPIYVKINVADMAKANALIKALKAGDDVKVYVRHGLLKFFNPFVYLRVAQLLGLFQVL